MEFVLKPLSIDELKIGAPAHLDLFDASGILLLAKGQPVTSDIWERLLSRQVHALEYTPPYQHRQRGTSVFSPLLYGELVCTVQCLFDEMHMISSIRLTETTNLINDMVEELSQSSRIYLDFHKLRSHDNYTYVHSVNVSILATLIGIEMRYDRSSLEQLALGALFHDIGKQTVPLELLHKPTGLTPEEFDIIKSHPVVGEHILKQTVLSPGVLDVVRHHHERWNGKGYPDRLTERGIPPLAQIAAVADVFDALTSDRPYRPGLPPYHALEMVIAGTGQDFSERTVQAFTRCLVLYPEHSVVRLNTGELGTVIAVPRNHPTRPLIRVLFDSQGRMVQDYQTIDLLKDLTRFIKTVEFNH